MTMVEKKPENESNQAQLSPIELEFSEILCAFQFDGQDCWIIEFDSNDCDATFCKNLNDSEVCKEICRFEIHGHSCAIIQKEVCLQNDENDLADLLSPREIEIAALVALGCPNKQIADKLHISEWTVATYISRLCTKLRVHKRAAVTFRCASLICKQDIFLK